MRILGIETSCDETGSAIVESSPDNTSVKLVASSLATSMEKHAITGGIIPEVAARNQSTYIVPVIYEALEKANLHPEKNTVPDIDAIAVTYGPGLIGSLLVGVETAKTLSYIWNKPLIPVNHLFGHIYANFIQTTEEQFTPPQFPAIVLIVSGGHTDIIYMKTHTDIEWLGGTRDDAAGEAFDKIGRLLDLPYPAGPLIEKYAHEGDPTAYHFPRPIMYDGSFDFSFSGLKTAVLREVEKLTTITPTDIANISRGVQDAISDVLIHKTLKAAEAKGATAIILSGGVAANQTLRDKFQQALDRKYASLGAKLHAPIRSLCTDNGTMIAAAGFFQSQPTSWQALNANPELYFG